MSETLSGKKVLVTGGLGFIGSNLVIELVKQGARVVIADLPDGGLGANWFNIEPVRGDVEVLDVDIRQAEHLSSIIARQELIFLLAGQVSHPGSMQRPLLDLDVNCRSHLALLEVCRQVNRDVRLVFSSTRQLYGRPQYLPVDERHVVRPVDVNGISKFAAEQLFRLYYENYGIRSVSLRLTNVYGPRMDLMDPTKGFIGVFLSRALRGEPIEVFGSGEQRRDFNFVSDVVRAMMLAIECPDAWGESLNLAHPNHCSLNEFLQTLGCFISFESSVTEFPPERKAIDVGDYYGTFEKLQRVCGWQPQVDLTDGLQQTVEYFLRTREHYLPPVRPVCFS